MVAGFALIATVLSSGTASAEPPHNLPQSAGGTEQSFSPAYDYDTDGCYATPAIGPDGTINPGLQIGGAVNGNCHDQSDLDNSQTYSRTECNNGWCAIVYSSYFEKDQVSDGGASLGHKDEWEQVISWVNQERNQVDFVSVTQHSGFSTYGRDQVLFDGSHPKVVYHKDGPGTHNFRLAGTNDDPPENFYHNWRYPPIVDYNLWPSIDLRNAMINHDWHGLTTHLDDYGFKDLVGRAKPSGIPFQP
ncbi:NPP1 family protein [Amycolatopsis rhabdoformis]|uniref:NPP1 family protein n=1 Tax=Amycolatopsis rhabdoformis TaxID=1448059 RepID=A0ABZ1I2R5_9PSEU|nr:NPP1 family protein [Amycolatopsis rhabdoformis]WSE28097.1 NPP1 family protein [Amycolatopsis rhabdoformis]